MIKKLKNFWQEFTIWHDEMQWQNSAERRELATKRLAIYRKFMNGDPSYVHSPYTHPEIYNLY